MTRPADAASQRLRAAWLYHSRGLTQKEVAELLGLSRARVIRLLDEAAVRGEVTVWINEDPEAPDALAMALEARYGLAEAIVTTALPDPTRAVGAALGHLLSEVLADDMAVGVGWGRTFQAALKHVVHQRRNGMRVVSLLGGIATPGAENPVEFAWRLAALTGSDCHLFLAPLIVDSADTRARLMHHCGLDRIMTLAAALDLAVLSCGDPRRPAGSLAADYLAPQLRAELVAAGAVCEVMGHFLDAKGSPVNHPLAGRLMAADLQLVAQAGHVILATGGADRAEAIAAALVRFPGCTLITDESAARALIA